MRPKFKQREQRSPRALRANRERCGRFYDPKKTRFLEGRAEIANTPPDLGEIDVLLPAVDVRLLQRIIR